MAYIGVSYSLIVYKGFKQKSCSHQNRAALQMDAVDNLPRQHNRLVFPVVKALVAVPARQTFLLVQRAL